MSKSVFFRSTLSYMLLPLFRWIKKPLVKHEGVYKVHVVYKHDGCTALCNEAGVFWNAEGKYWSMDGTAHEYWACMSYDEYLKLPPSPNGVSDVVFHIKYFMHGSKYTRVTRTYGALWPFRGQCRKMPPMLYVLLLDEHRTCVHNVTRKMYKLQGPFGWHEEDSDVQLQDLFSYSEWSSLQIVMMFRNNFVIDKNLTLRSLWTPNKT